MKNRRKGLAKGRWSIMLVILLAGAFLLLRLRAGQLEQAGEYQPRPLRVLTEEAATGDLTVTGRYLATLEPATAAEVSSRVTAPIVGVKAGMGDVVSAGEVLAELDDSEVKHQLAALEARSEEAASELEGLKMRSASLEQNAAYLKKEAERAAFLVSEGAIPESDAEAAAVKSAEALSALRETASRMSALSARRKSLRAETATLRERLGYYTVKSPFDGVVTARMAQEGNLAVPGTPLFSVENRDGWDLVFKVPQEDLPLVKAGSPVSGRVGTDIVTALVARVSPSVDHSGMARVEAVVNEGPDARFGRGVSLTVDVTLQVLEEKILVPLDAVVATGEAPFAYVVSDGRLVRRDVRVLASDGSTAAVEGLEEGDVVVVHSPWGWAALSEGREVTTE